MDDIQFLITYPPTQRSDTIYGSPLIMSFCLKYARLFISYSCFINIIWKIKVMNDRFRIHNINIWLYFYHTAHTTRMSNSALVATLLRNDSSGLQDSRGYLSIYDMCLWVKHQMESSNDVIGGPESRIRGGEWMVMRCGVRNDTWEFVTRIGRREEKRSKCHLGWFACRTSHFTCDR